MHVAWFICQPVKNVNVCLYFASFSENLLSVFVYVPRYECCCSGCRPNGHLCGSKSLLHPWGEMWLRLLDVVLGECSDSVTLSSDINLYWQDFLLYCNCLWGTQWDRKARQNVKRLALALEISCQWLVTSLLTLKYLIFYPKPKD